MTLYPRVRPAPAVVSTPSHPRRLMAAILAEASVNVRYGLVPSHSPLSKSTSRSPGEVVSPREVVVVGKGTALPENNVVVQALDRNGRVLDEQAAIVDAELGGTGEWRAILRPNAAPGTCRPIYAYSTSPADGRILADAAVFVTYGQAQQQPVIDITSPTPGAVVNTARRGPGARQGGQRVREQRRRPGPRPPRPPVGQPTDHGESERRLVDRPVHRLLRTVPGPSLPSPPRRPAASRRPIGWT